MDTYSENFWVDTKNNVKGVTITFVNKKSLDKFMKSYEAGKIQIAFQVDKM